MSVNPNGGPAGYYYQAGATTYSIDPAGAFSLASAPTIDLYSGPGASAPRLADPGAYIPFTGATSESEEIVELAGYYSLAGASAPTIDPYGGLGASAPTRADAGVYIPFTGGTPEAVEIVDPAGAYSGRGAGAPTLAATGADIPVTGATSSAAQIVSPAGTYAPPGASAPIADPGGTYSAAGASAPTTDPAGTYSSPYALDRLFLSAANTSPTNAVLSFQNATAVANYFGATSFEASLASEFFAGYSGTSATFLISRYSLGGERAHLFGANISNVTLSQLQSISGSVSITFQGWTYSGSINLSGVASFSAAASAIASTFNSSLPLAAVTSGSSIAPVSVSFTGSIDGILLQVTSVSAGSIELGAQISGPGIPAGAQIVVQNTGTPGGPGLYTLYQNTNETISSEAMTESYGVLTVGSVTSGTVADGELVTGAGVASLTAIDDNLSGSGAGSTWLVNNAQTVVGEQLAMTATPLTVTYNSIVGATANRDYFEVSTAGGFGFDNNPSSLSYMSGTAATALGLTQASGALDSTPGGEPTSAAAFMNNLVQNENGQFGSFEGMWPQLAQEDPAYLGNLAAWAQSTDGLYTFSQSTTTTTPAGSSLPTTDPAGTYSGAGASAPTTDAPGSYSLAGAGAPTLAQPGYYVPTSGASSETPDDPGYYTPYAGATAEILALPPVISATEGGQTVAPPLTDTPFGSVTISDPNIDAIDSLTIQLTGLGGALADGAGFTGLTTSAPGVYLLSGTANAITPELDALVFTSAAGPGTTTFTLTDTTSAGTSASDATTTVTVLSTTSINPNGAPTGYFYQAGATAYIEDPAGTYSLAGATTPIADPAGTHSAAGASAPTEDQAGGYTPPYALDRLILDPDNTVSPYEVVSFNSETAVANYFGSNSLEASLATEFFADYGSSATLLFTRYPVEGSRAHLFGANISNMTLGQLQALNGSLSITSQGYNFSATVNLSGATSFANAATMIQNALNANLPVAATTTGSSITPVSVSFTASQTGANATNGLALLDVTAISSGAIQIGAYVSGAGITPEQIYSQVSGTPGGVGVYNIYTGTGAASSETMTETYGVLTVGSVSSGTVADGELVTGAGVAALTAIETNLSGSGAGSTWLVNYAQTVAGENMTMTAAPLSVLYTSTTGPTASLDYFDIAQNGNFAFDSSSLSYAGGTAAASLGLTQASGAFDSSSGEIVTNPSAWMNYLVQNETDQFETFQTIWPQLAQLAPQQQAALEAWAQATDGQFLFLQNYTSTTSPAGWSTGSVDPAGTYSGPGASLPTPAAAGTYIPGTAATSSAAEVVDPAGTYSGAGASAPTTDLAGTYSGAGASAPTTDAPGSYSLAGASAPTLAQPGYYVPTAGASSETPDDPGYYTPYAGASAEILALPPVISGTEGGQTVAPSLTDTPFGSVTISDPNIDTTDSLTIQLTGAGGALTDGANYNGLTSSRPGVYLLSGTAGEITSELDALIFIPGTNSGTTTFTLTDTTSPNTSASDATTTVTVEPGGPVVVSVSTFLADQSQLDETPGGFDISDTAANITASLDQLNDPNIDAITISDNGQLAPSVHQLTSDATAIGKLENAVPGPVLLAIKDTAADVQAGLSTLVADASEIATITASNGPVMVSTTTFLADQPTLDKIVGGFAISDTAADVAANLNALNGDSHVTSIALTDGGTPVLTISIAEALNDTRALSEIASLHTVALADTAAGIELITSTQASALKTDGYKSIASTTGAVAMTITEAETLSGDGIAVTGAKATASGTVAAMTALSTTEASTLVGQGYSLAVLDSAANIQKLTTTQISALSARHVTQINASDTTVLLSPLLVAALESAGVKVSAPSNDTVVISGIAANLEALTASQITGLSAIGATGLVSTNANVSYTSAQTAAILASGLSVSAAGSYTVTENFVGGNYSVYQSGQLIQQKTVNSDGSYDIAYFDITGQTYSSYETIYNTAAAPVAYAVNNVSGSGNLLLYTNAFTITSASGSESVTLGSDSFAVTPHSVETTTIENSKSNETFVYGAGFGQDTIAGFLATSASHDHLQFSHTMFGFSSTATQTADATALLNQFASGTTNTVITDQAGDTLTLSGVTIATLKANLADFKFT